MKNGDTYSVGRLGRIVVKDVRSSSGVATTKYAWNVSCDIDLLLAENLRPQPQDTATSFFRQESQSTIRTFVVRGFTPVIRRNWPGSSNYVWNLNGKGGTFVLEDAVISLDPSFGRFFTLGTGAWSVIRFGRCNMDSGGMFGIVQAGAASVRTIVMEDCNIKGVPTVWDVRSLTDFVLNNNVFDTIATGIIRPWTDGVEPAAVRARVRGVGNRFLGTVVQIAAQNSGRAEVYSYDISADPASAAWLATTNGQFLTSTQAATEGGMAMRQNGQWVALGTGASGVNTLIT
jgi:hypothetical protein